MMKKAIIVEPEKPLNIVDVPMEAIPLNGVRLQITHAGVCHSDLHLVEDKVDIGDGKVWRLSEAVGLYMF